MLLTLVKKDFLLIKKYILFMIILSLIIPIYLSLAVPFLGGLVAFLMSVIFTEFIMYQQVSIIESKYPKSSTLLCTSPYSRSTIVFAKYLFFIAIFVICLLSYFITSLILPMVIPINLSIIFFVLMICGIAFSIYAPLMFKLGYEKTKFFFVIVIFSFSFGIPMIAKMNIDITPLLNTFKFIIDLPEAIKCILLILASILFLGTSLYLSIKIYSKKEL